MTGGPVFLESVSMNPIHGLIALALCGVVTTGLAVAADPKSGAPPKEEAPDPAAVQRGKQSYADHCSHCHGFSMVSSGNVTYDLRTFPHDQKDRFLEIVVNGKNNRMPPWGDVLPLDEINDIWAYVLTGGKG